MFKSTNVTFYTCLCLISLTLSLFAGCGSEEQNLAEPYVKLYVDAVQLRELDENEKAIEKLNTAVQLNNRFSLAYSLLGEIYQEMKDYEKSAAAYKNATMLNPWSFKEFFNLGRAYQIMKRFAQAVKAYVRACELKPNHLEAHINAAKSYYEIKDYNKALIYGGRAEKINPNVSEIQKLLGDVYESQKDYEQAIRSYKRALEMNSNDPDVMTSLAIVYLRTNRNEPAKELLTSVIQIQPDNNTAHNHLGYFYLQSYFQVIEDYESEQKKDDKNPEIMSSLAKDMHEALNKATECYSRAIEINDNDWEAHKGLGVVYIARATDKSNKDDELKAKLKEKAVQQWRLSLNIKPDQPLRENILKLIKKYSK